MAVTVVNNENFKNEVLKADKPVLVGTGAAFQRYEHSDAGGL